MQAHDFFLSLLIILLTARVFAELATRLKSPAVIGLMSVVIKRFDANSEIPGLIPTTAGLSYALSCIVRQNGQRAFQ